MEDIWKIITEKLKGFREHWAVWSVVGSGALYLLGYLVMRYQATLLGIGTSLDLVDEKYFFGGAKFAVYLLTTLPSLVLMLVPVGLGIWILAKLLRAAGGEKWKACVDGSWRSFRHWWHNPTLLKVAGVIFSVLVIQFAMRQCFLFSNLLLARTLPDPRWLQRMLLEPSDTGTALYFAGLTFAASITAGFYFAARILTQQVAPTPTGGPADCAQTTPAPGMVANALEVLLALLLTVQMLLLPVNYSYFVANKSFPRVTSVGQEKVEVGRAAWLVWQTDKSATFLVCNLTNMLEGRVLSTVPGKETEKIQITAYDPLFQLLFKSPPSQKNSSMP